MLYTYCHKVEKGGKCIKGRDGRRIIESFLGNADFYKINSWFSGFRVLCVDSPPLCWPVLSLTPHIQPAL